MKSKSASTAKSRLRSVIDRAHQPEPTPADLEEMCRHWEEVDNEVPFDYAAFERHMHNQQTQEVF